MQEMFSQLLFHAENGGKQPSLGHRVEPFDSARKPYRITICFRHVSAGLQLAKRQQLEAPLTRGACSLRINCRKHM